MINNKSKFKVIANNFCNYNKSEMPFETIEEAQNCYNAYLANNNVQEVCLLEYDQFVGWSIKSTHNKQLLMD